MANPKEGVQLMNRKGEWGQNLPPKFTVDDPREGPQTGANKPKKRNPKRAIPPGDDGEGGGGGTGGPVGGVVVGTDVHTDSQGQQKVKTMEEFFKPKAKRAKTEMGEGLEPEVLEMRFRSLKVQIQEDKILGVDLSNVGIVSGAKGDVFQQELTHVPRKIEPDQRKIDPTSP